VTEFEIPLILTTPHIRGQKVKDAQYLLAGHNRTSSFVTPIRPYKGRIDGEYGPETALATKIAKYWLGYPTKAIDRRFGQQIYNLLKDKELPDDYLERRKDRIAEANQLLKIKALKFALDEQGNHESPYGSNCQKYGAWYGMNCVPWCAIFESYCICHVGGNWRYSYVPNIVADAWAGRNGLHITRSPEPGDLVSYMFHGRRDVHTAFFVDWADDNHYYFYDIGGNTGPVNMSNGGEVLKQTRNITQVSHFIRFM
jgi:hypothetical protein